VGLTVHHLDGGTMRPLGGGTPVGADPPKLVCHCLLIEAPDRLVLVDTGIGLGDRADLPRRFGRLLTFLGRPDADPENAVVRQVERLGFQPEDVRDVVLTHMDLDHVGGLEDFPHATVHVDTVEHAGAMARATRFDRLRYLPHQWAHDPAWELYPEGGEDWKGFPGARPVRGLGGDVLLVPLRGHSRGHCGVAVRSRRGWLLHAGDTYELHTEVDPAHPRCAIGPRLFQWFAAFDVAARDRSLHQLREVVRDRADEVSVFSSHCPVHLERLREQAAQ
jgi:glyoxylase-like metal-dependent hydrolase (beta-lactamase superfamily II)